MATHLLSAVGLLEGIVKLGGQIVIWEVQHVVHNCHKVLLANNELGVCARLKLLQRR